MKTFIIAILTVVIVAFGVDHIMRTTSDHVISLDEGGRKFDSEIVLKEDVTVRYEHPKCTVTNYPDHVKVIITYMKKKRH